MNHTSVEDATARNLRLGLIFFLLVVFAYSNTFFVPWHFDDYANIVNNKDLHITELTLNNLKKAVFSHPYIIEFPRPVVYFTFALNFLFGKFNVFGYHLVNLAIHLTSAVFIFLFLRNIRSFASISVGPFSAPFIAALLWALHPVHTEAVTYIAQRKVCLTGMFFMASFYFYSQAAQKAGNKVGLYVLCAITGLLAIGSRPNAFILPIMLLVYEYSFRQYQKPSYGGSRSFMILFYISMVVILFFLPYFESYAPKYQAFDFTPFTRILSAPRVLIFYFSLLMSPIPSRLSLDYDFPVSFGLFTPAGTFPAIFLLLLLIFSALKARKSHPLYFFSISWIILHLALETTIVPLDLIFIKRLYLPSLGFFILVTLGLAQLHSVAFYRRHVKAWNVLVWLIIFWLSAMTFMRNGIWGSEISLWKDSVSKAPDKARPLNNLGAAYSRIGENEAAFEYFQRAAEVNPTSPIVLRNLGKAYQDKKDYQKALYLLQQGLYYSPPDRKADPLNELASLMLEMERLPEALEYAEKAIAADDRNSNSWGLLAKIHHELDQREKAVEAMQQALELSSKCFSCFNYLGNLYLEMDQLDEAAQSFEKALQIYPNAVEVYNNYGSLLIRQGKFEEAIAKLKIAIDLNPIYLNALYNLGYAYYAQGDSESAVQTLRRLHNLNPKDAEVQSLLKKLETDLTGGKEEPPNQPGGNNRIPIREDKKSN